MRAGLSEEEHDARVLRALCASLGARCEHASAVNTQHLQRQQRLKSLLSQAANAPEGTSVDLSSASLVTEAAAPVEGVPFDGPWIVSFPPMVNTAARTAAPPTGDFAPAAGSESSNGSSHGAGPMFVVSLTVGIDEGSLAELRSYGRRMKQLSASIAASVVGRGDVQRALGAIKHRDGAFVKAVSRASAGAATDNNSATGNISTDTESSPSDDSARLDKHVIAVSIVANRRRRSLARASIQHVREGAVVGWTPLDAEGRKDKLEFAF